MSANIDQNIIEMKFDNKQFESNVSTSLSTIDKLKKSLNFDGAERAFDSISSAAKNCNMSGLVGAVESVGLKFSALQVMAATALSNITNSAVNAGKRIVSALTIDPIKSGFQEYETQINAVQTILANTQNVQKSASKEAIDSINATAEAAALETAKASESSLETLKETQSKQLDEFNKMSSDKIDALKEEHEEALDLVENYYDEELDMLEDKYEQESEALDKAIDEETSALKEAHEEKLALYQEEYMEKLRVIDEERYNRLKAVDDQIDSINALTKAEEEQLQIQKQNKRLAELRDDVLKADDPEKRRKAQERLSEYENEIARKQLLKQREALIENLKLSKEAIAEQYDELELQIQDEYYTQVENENAFYELQSKNLKEEQAAKKKALKEDYEDTKEFLQNSKEEELKQLKKIQETELKNLKEQQDAEKAALKERFSSELDALESYNKQALANIETRKNEELKALNAVSMASGKGSTLSDVNKALDELNEYADKTIYNFTEMTRNIGTFTAAGIDLDTSVSAIKGIANLAAVSGSTSQQASTAMYQLSQALASGTVKLMDWNSVVNAGMGGQVFQNALKETARVHGIAIDEMIMSEGSFRETLQKGWLTSDILTETLSKFTGDLNEEQLKSMGYAEDQIKEIIKLGQTANDAATKVKTFTQLFDTLKEAAQSGWTQSWEIIVGDFEEAKSLLTEASNIFGGIIGDAAEKRNAVLFGGLSSGWKQLLDEGIMDEESFIEEITKNAGDDFKKITEESDNFEVALKKGIYRGIITSDTLAKSIKSLGDKIHGMSEEERKAAGYTSEHLASIEKLEAGIQDGTVSMENFISMIGNLSGRENIIESFRNVLRGVVLVIKPITEAFKEIFPPVTAERIFSITESIRKLTEHFKNFVSETKFADNLKSTFKGLFAILDIVGQAFSAVFNAVNPLFGWIVKLSGGVLEITAHWGDWISALDKSIRKNDIFGQSIQKVIDFFKNLINKVKEIKDKVVEFLTPAIETVKRFVSSLAEKFKAPGLEFLHSLLQRIQKRLSQICELFSDFKSAVSVAVDAAAKVLKKSKILPMFEALWNGIKTLTGGIISAVGSLADSVIEKLSNADFAGAFDLINSFLGVGIGVGITKFLKSAVDVFKGFKDITEGITNVFDGVRGCLEAYQTKLKAGTLMTIALAIGVLAASLVAVSLIDSEKLTGATAAITTLFAALVSSMAILESVSKSKGKIAGVSALLITMSIAVLALTLSLKSISELNPDELAVGITGVMSLVASLVAATKILQNGSAGAVKGMAQMILLAAAVKILASACEDLSALKWNELAKGLAGVGVLMVELVFFLNTAKFSGKTITTATGIVILAAAIKILASACNDFAQMNVEQLTKGLVAVGALLAEILAFTNLTGNAKHVMSTGISLITIAAAMKILASAINDLSGLTWEQLAIGLTGMAVSLGAVTAAVNLMPKNMTSLGIGLIAVSTAMVILASALGTMGGMEWEGIAKGLAALGGAVGILAAGLNLMKGTLAGSAAMLVASAAVLALVPALSILGAMSWEGIVKGLVALAGAFTVIGVAGLVLGPIVPVILALSGAFALIGVGVLAVGAGLLAAGAGLSAMAVGITALATAASVGATAIVASLTVIVMGIADLIPAIIKKFGEGVIEFCKVIKAGAPEVKDAIKALVMSTIEVVTECVPAIVDGVLSLIVSLLESLVEYTPRIVDSLMKFIIELINGIARNLPELIASVVNLLMSLFNGVIAALKNVDMEVLIKGIAGIGFLSSIMLALSAMALLVPGAIIGVAGMGLVIAELALVLAAIGKMAKIPGLTEMVSGSTNLLTVIGTAIGGFVGGITGGFMSGVSSQFPKIASDLSDFMTNIKPFVDGASSIGGSMLTGVLSLTAAITALTAASLINGLTSWITGGVSMLTFGQELAGFGPYFKRYYESIKGINGSVVESSANAAKALAEMATNLPNSGGVAAWFAGENSLSKFADELVIFGPKLKRYADSVKGLDSEVVVNSANAAKALAEMAKNLPNSGGVAGWFAGENNLSDFADELVAFGPKLKLYASSVKGLDPEVISNSTEAAKAISEMAKNLPNQGGVVNWFTGDNTLSMFGHELAIFAPFLKSYANNVKGIDTEVVECSVNAAKTISEMAKNLPNKGGIVSWFAGDNDIGSFGESLETFGKGFAGYYKHIKDIDPDIVLSTKSAASAFAEIQNNLPKSGGIFSNVKTLKDFGKEVESFGSSLKDYYKSVKDINTTVLASVIAEANKLIEMAHSMADIDTKSMTNFGASLYELGCTGVSKFAEAFEGAKKKVESVAKSMLSTFSSAAENKAKDLKKMFDDIVDGLISVFIAPKNLLDITKSATDLMVSFEKGIKGGEANVNSAVVSVVMTSVDCIRKKRNDFYSAATHLLNAIVESVKNQTAAVVSYFTKLAVDAVNGIRGKRNDFYKAAEYVVGGFSAGVSDNLEKTSSSADNLADTFLKSFKKKLDINSPSKETEYIGENTGLGFINAINGFLDKAYDAGYNMADKALNGISKAISKVNDFLDGNFDAEPTIRPVLDLSDVQNGLGQLNGLMGGIGGYSLADSVDMANSIGASMKSRTVNNFVDGNLEKSPGSENSKNVINNNFYITGNDPKEIANQVSRIIQRQVERRESAWA